MHADCYGDSLLSPGTSVCRSSLVALQCPARGQSYPKGPPSKSLRTTVKLAVQIFPPHPPTQGTDYHHTFRVLEIDIKSVWEFFFLSYMGHVFYSDGSGAESSGPVYIFSLTPPPRHPSRHSFTIVSSSLFTTWFPLLPVFGKEDPFCAGGDMKAIFAYRRSAK